MAAVLNGVAGELRAGYARAARIVNFNLSQPDGVNWQLGATLANPNPVYMEGRSEFTIVLNVGVHQWFWRKVTPGIEGARLMWSGDAEPEIR